jgi:hypothetical protein
MRLRACGRLPSLELQHAPQDLQNVSAPSFTLCSRVGLMLKVQTKEGSRYVGIDIR